MEEKYSIFVTQGGLGKQVASTAVAQAIKNNYPDRKLIVVSSYPEVYINNPYTYKVFRLGGAPYFYRDYIYEKDSIVFYGEPYNTTEHIYKRKHLVQSWCELHNLKYNNEKPQLYFNQAEKDLIYYKYISNKPICILQTNGGLYTLDKPYCWTRDIPFSQSQQIVNRLREHYAIYHVARPKCYNLEGVTLSLPEIPKRELLSLLLISHKRILIDSCLQHAAAALDLPSTVCWIGTSSKTFGYSIHKNIEPKIEKDMNHLSDSFLFDFDFNGNGVEYPYSTNELFDIDKIVA